MRQFRVQVQRQRANAGRHVLRLFSLAIMLAAVGLTLNSGPTERALADPSSPLTVTKTANPSPVASGGQLTYTITIVNTGGAKVTNLGLTDQVQGVGVIQNPPALPQLIMTSTKGTCTQGGVNGNVVTCPGGTLNGGETWVVTIRGQVTASNGTSLNNTASVTGTKSAQNFTTNASVSTLVQGGTGTGPLPDLTINKTGPSSVAISSPMTYTLTPNNVGTVAATNVRVVDTLPPDVTFTSVTATSLFICTADALAPVTVTCTGGAINAGANGTITINGTSPAAVPAGGQITNTAVIDPDNTIVESNELNNTSASVYTTVTSFPTAGPLLDIKKTDGKPSPTGTWWNGAGPDPVNPGQKITYKILVTNNATGNNSRADDVVVTDGTQGLDAASIIATQVIVNGTVGNGNGCVVAAPQITCKIRSLNSLGTITITITGTVVSSAGSTIFNTATVTGNVKNTGVSNTASEATTVSPAIDLTITKADSPDPVCARSWPTSASVQYAQANQHLTTPFNFLADPPSGSVPEILAPPVCLGGLTYMFVVGNSGNQNASAVVVRDPLPAGLILDSYSTDAGFTCAVDVSNVVTCSGGSIPLASIRNLTFRVVAPPTVGTITNTVYIDPNNAIFEPDETNNTFAQTTTVATGIDLVTYKSDSKHDPDGANPPGPVVLTPGSAIALADGYDPIATRGTQTYTIIVDNVGTQDSTGIRLRDTLPADTVFLSVTPDPAHTAGFTCSHNGAATGGVVECIGGHLLGTESEFYDPAGAPPPTPAGDDYAVIKIRVFARATVGTMNNEVRVDPLNEITEFDELNNIATDSTQVTVGNADKGAYHQLKVTKTNFSPGPGTVASNGVLTYDLLVENLGTDPVSNITLVDTLPAGSRFIDAKDTDTGSDAFFCSHSGAATGGVVTCTGGDLDGSINTIPVGGVSRNVRVKVFAPNTLGTYTNLATVDPANVVPEGNEFDNDAQVNTIVVACTSPANCTALNAFYELTIEKTQNRSTIARNGLETYTLKVTNLGSDPVSDIVVEDSLPVGARLLDAKDSAGPADPDRFTCGAPNASNVITCTGGDLSGTAVALTGIPTSREIIVRVFMPDTPATYPNQAVVDPYNAIPEGNEFNNQSSLPTVVQNGGPDPWIDLKVDKTQLVPDPADANNTDDHSHTGVATPNGGIQYNLAVSNTGEGDAFNVTLRDVLPATATLFSAVDAAGGPGNFSCGLLPGQPQTVECIGGTIPAGGSRSVKVTVVAPKNLDKIATNLGDIEQTLTNSAFVDPLNSTPEGDESNNVDSIETRVRSRVDLTLTKEGPAQATQNQTTEYTIKVKNNEAWGAGKGALAENVKVIDGLPTGLIPIGSIVAGGNFLCQVLENPVNFVSCTGSLAAGAEVEIKIPVFITADGGTLDNEACVDPDKTIDETNELNNCAHALTQVTPPVEPANLSVDKTASTGTVTAGQEFTYTVAVSNIGGTDATGTITMTDDLPAVVELMGVNPASGWSCPLPLPATPNHLECTRTGLAAGSTENIVISVKAKTGAGAPTQAFTNKAEVTGNSETEFDEVIVGVGGAGFDLLIQSITDTPDPVNRTKQLTYTILAVNAGTADADGAVVRVHLPDAGVSVSGVAATNGFNCVVNPAILPAGMTYDCTAGVASGFPAGGDTTITAVVTVNLGAPDELIVTATADPDNAFVESDEINNTKSEPTTVDDSVCTSPPCVDLVVSSIVDVPDGAPFGPPIIYNVAITNVGDAPLPTNVAWDIHFELAGPGVILSISIPTGVTCVPPAGTHLHCIASVGADDMDLAAGAGIVFTLTVQPSAPGNLLLTVVADSNSDAPLGSPGEIAEFSDGNNFLTESTLVNP